MTETIETMTPAEEDALAARAMRMHVAGYHSHPDVLRYTEIVRAREQRAAQALAGERVADDVARARERLRVATTPEREVATLAEVTAADVVALVGRCRLRRPILSVAVQATPQRAVWLSKVEDAHRASGDGMHACTFVVRAMQHGVGPALRAPDWYNVGPTLTIASSPRGIDNAAPRLLAAAELALVSVAMLAQWLATTRTTGAERGSIAPEHGGSRWAQNPHPLIAVAALGGGA